MLLPFGISVSSLKLLSSAFHKSQALCSIKFSSIGKRKYPWMDRARPYWVEQESHECDSDVLKEHSKSLKEDRESQIIDKISSLKFKQSEKKEWIPNVTQRVGAVGVKIGLYPMWSKSGDKLDCTVIQIQDNHALNYIPPSKIGEVHSLKDPRGYWINNKSIPSWINNQRWGLQMVGSISVDPAECTPEWNNMFTKYGVPTKRKITRFLVSPDAALEPGTSISVRHFSVGDYIDITARTINRQFQGGIERHGMSGGPAAHGSTKFHRRTGSLAGGGGKVYRDKRMAGLMGNRYRTTRGKQILRLNPRLGLIYVLGPTPGPVNSYCLLYDSWLCNRRRALEQDTTPSPPVPTWIPTEAEIAEEIRLMQESINTDDDDPFSLDIYHDCVHKPDDDSIEY